MVYGVVVDDPGVDLVGELDEIPLARPGRDGFEGLPAVYGARWIVGVDDHDAARAVGGLGADVVEVRCPAVGFAAAVVNRYAAREFHDGRPQRIVGGRQEHFVAVVEERLHAHGDQLADTVADRDVVDVDVGDPLPLAVLHDGLARRVKSLRLAVALRRGHVVDHVAEQLLGCVKSERRGIADVELEDAVPFLLQAVGLGENRAANLVAHVRELGRFDDVGSAAWCEGRHLGGFGAHWARPSGRTHL